jgi:centromere protein I
MALARQTGSDPSVLGLLRVYKNYYPEIVVGTVTKGRASAFKHPDPAWRDRLDSVQAAHARREQNSRPAQQNGFRVSTAFGSRRASSRTVVPSVHTLHAQESSITLEEVDSADQLAEKLEQFELPSQMAAVLADPLLQKLMLLRPEPQAKERLEAWLDGCLQDIVSGELDERFLSDMLEVIRSYVVSTQVGP